MEHTIDWRSLIPPVDPADIPLTPPADLEPGTTQLNAACEVAVALVNRNALDGTASLFTTESRSKWVEALLMQTYRIGCRLRDTLDEYPDWHLADFDEQVAVAAEAARNALLVMLERDFRSG